MHKQPQKQRSGRRDKRKIGKEPGRGGGGKRKSGVRRDERVSGGGDIKRVSNRVFLC